MRLHPLAAITSALLLTTIARADNVGYETVLGSSQASVKDTQIATKVTLAEPGTVTTITAYVGGKKDKKIRYALYEDAAGEPGSLLAETAVGEQATDAMAWFTLDLADTTVAAGDYWLALSFEDDNQVYRYAATGGAHRTQGNKAVDGYDDPWGTSDTSGTRQISIYATYATVDSSGTPFKVVTGTYTGDEVDDRTINGVGFQPDVVIVKADDNKEGFCRTSTMVGDVSKPLKKDGAVASNRIQSIVADGFVIGDDDDVNKSGKTYHWVAFQAGTGTMAVGSYTGDGIDDRSLSGLGFAPGCVLVLPEEGKTPVLRTGQMVGDGSVTLQDEEPKADRIQGLEADGFQVGTDDRVNKSGKPYHYIAWKTLPLGLATGHYTGDATDDRDITTVGFQPVYVLLKVWKKFPVQRMDSMVGDETAYLKESAHFTNGIQDLLVDGFQVGDENEVNENGKTVYWVAFANAPPAVFTDVSSDTSFDVQTTNAADDGSSVHWGDLDADGDLDAVITGNVARVLTSTSAGTSFFVATLGTGDAAGQGGFLDVDHDGDLDFWQRDLALYQNNGSGALSDAGDLGFIEPTTNESVAVGDVDGDGWCDVVMFSGTNGNWIGHHQRSSTTALAGANETSYGLNDLGDYGDGDYASSGHVNGDDFLDFFYHYGGGKLFLSDGDGTFTESASGISVVTGETDKIGSAWGDYDNDGDLDLFVPRYDSGNPGYLWQNTAGTFADVTAAAGITNTSGQRSACWGDYDNDGDLDLYIVTHSGAANEMFQNQGDGTFLSATVGAEANGDGHDAVFVDYDNDGDLDLAVTEQGSTNILLRNDTDDTNYLKVRVVGWGAWATNKAGVGVKVELYEATGTTLLARRDTGVARGYAGSEPLWVHFGGVAAASTYVVKVHFQSGTTSTTLVPSTTSTTIGATTINQMLTVTEGQPDLQLIRWQETDPLD